MSQELLTPAPAKKRLLSLDVLRGITIAGMILVNNPGTWSHIYAPLRHAAWNGCTPTDLVFPFFVFCMGIAMYISHKKTSHALTWPVAQKVITRGLLIVIIGWALSWLGMFLGQITKEGITLLQAVWTYPIEHIRILGVSHVWVLLVSLVACSCWLLSLRTALGWLLC